MSKPVVAIVGRPNVGKSTLFNRFTGGMVAIVEDTPGVTRDRLYRNAEWLGREFTLVDTGGIQVGEKVDDISAQVRKQAEIAMEEADVILFVVDGRTGLTVEDEVIVSTLRRAPKPVILVVNKIENFDRQTEIYDFYGLGLGEPVAISAAHGLNTGDLLDRVVAHFPLVEEETYSPDTIRIAVIGRPNVGKSSLINAILGEERVIVSDVPGTTRDAIDTQFERDGNHYVLIDTAGMRRRARISEATERYSVVRALRAVDRADVSLLILDAVPGVTEQDKKIAGYAHEGGKASVIIVNKWDLIAKDEHTMKRFDETVRSELGFLHYAPTLYVSALTRQRVPKILELVDFVAEQHARRITTGVLNSLLSDAVQLNPPPGARGKRLKILYGTQIAVKPPSFVLFVNDPELMHFSYLRYLENQLRQSFGFEGTPLKIIVRQRAENQ